MSVINCVKNLIIENSFILAKVTFWLQNNDNPECFVFRYLKKYPVFENWEVPNMYNLIPFYSNLLTLSAASNTGIVVVLLYSTTFRWRWSCVMLGLQGLGSPRKHETLLHQCALVCIYQAAGKGFHKNINNYFLIAEPFIFF